MANLIKTLIKSIGHQYSFEQVETAENCVCLVNGTCNVVLTLTRSQGSSQEKTEDKESMHSVEHTGSTSAFPWHFGIYVLNTLSKHCLKMTKKNGTLNTIY